MRYLYILLLCSSCLRAQERDFDFYIKTAIQRAPVFQDLHNQTALNRQDSLLIRATLRPQIRVGGAAYIAPYIQEFGYDPALSNGGFLNALVGINQPVFVPKENIAAPIRALVIQNERLQNNAQITQQDIRRSVGIQYITAFSMAQQLAFNRQMLDLLRREDLVFKRLTEQNIYRQIDYLTFLTSLHQQEISVRQLEMQYQNEVANLNYQCGITDTAAVLLQVPTLQIPVLPPVEHTVFYHQYTLDSLQIMANDQLVDLPYRPAFNVFGDAGFNSSFIDHGWKNFGFSTGVSATILLYDGQQRRLQHQKAALFENTRTGYRDFFRLQYQQEVNQAYQQLTALDQLDAAAQLQLLAARTLIDANGRLLRTGDVRVVDYLIAIGNLLNVQNQLTFNQINRLLILNQLNFRNAPF